MRYWLIVGRIPEDENRSFVTRASSAKVALRRFAKALYRDEHDQRAVNRRAYSAAVLVVGLASSPSPIALEDMPDMEL